MCAERGLEGVVAKALTPPTAGPSPRELGEGQDLCAPGVHHRRMAAGQGRRASTSGRCCSASRARRRPRYVGRVGSGLGEEDLDAPRAAAGPLARQGTPFSLGAECPAKQSVFCEPRLVVEVRFAHWTAPGAFATPHTSACARTSARGRRARGRRAPAPARQERTRRSRWRPPPASATSAQVQVQGRELSLTNLPKVLYPASCFTKRELIELLRRHRTRDARAPVGPRPHRHPLARRGGRQVVLPEAGASAQARMAQDRTGGARARRKEHRLRDGRGHRGAGVAGQRRRDRAPRAARPGAGAAAPDGRSCSTWTRAPPPPSSSAAVSR